LKNNTKESIFSVDYTMSKFSILIELWGFLKERKKWWLAPILVFLLFFGTVIVLAEGSVLAPFIYALF
tara:strand:- start:878 stop:1081 length:204 start_codon:yes stop_codon:yes gene_type:complete